VAIAPREGAFLGVNMGRPIVTNGDYGIVVRKVHKEILLPLGW